ncbi:MAG: hypothetical protein ACXWUI_15050 [Burkholderiales bacterium]
MSGVLAFAGNFLPDEWLTVPLLAVPVFIVSMWMSYRSGARYSREVRRREAQPVPAEELASKDRPPVVYLRSFDDDRSAASMRGKLTEEEHLALVLRQIGPFVAVGRPGESLPEVGASRVYLPDESWQQAVDQLLCTARLVVIRTGSTTGLAWEIERAVRVLTPERLVVLVDSARELRSVLARIRSVYPHVQPRLRMGWRRIGSIRGFIVFDDHWQASRLRVRGAGLYIFCQEQGSSWLTAPRLARTLRPVFRRLGMKWQRPPINVGLVGYLAVAAVVMVGLAVWGS